MSVVEEIVPVLVPPEVENTTTEPPEVSELLLASFAISHNVTDEPDATEELETVISEFEREMAPGFTVIVGMMVVTVVPPTCAVSVVAVPDVTPVNVAVYVPLLLSVTELKVPVLEPPVRPNTTLKPVVERLLPAASRARSVTVTVLPEDTVPEDTVTREFAADRLPGFTVTLGKVDVTETPPMVPPIVVAVPATTPVNVAV